MLVVLAVALVPIGLLMLDLGQPARIPPVQAYGPPSSGAASATIAPSSSPADPASVGPSPTAVAPASAATLVGGRFGEGLLIADRANGRLLIVSLAGRTLWTFPVAGSMPAGQRFNADDAFLSPDGQTIVANDEAHQVVDRINIVSRRLVWQYGRYDRIGSAPGYLHTPDDAYPLANGDVSVADIGNCRILEIDPARKIVRQWGQTGHCVSAPPGSFAHPNGDTPLPDGGMLVTEIGGSRIVRLSASGKVIFHIDAPVRYPSDAQLLPDGSILVADYSSPGAVLKLSPAGVVLWRYGPASGGGMLNHPSLAIELTNGTIAVNDDFRNRVVVIDPARRRIIWQYGRTDRSSRAPGFLFVPDGIAVVPLGTPL